ncbi:MAG: hypothetical protein WCJ70_00925 [bacterium]
MPVLRVEYNPTKLDEAQLHSLAVFLSQKISESIKRPIEDVSVYAFPYHYTLNGADVEIYIEIGSKSLPESKEVLLGAVTEAFREYRQTHVIDAVVNLSVTEMNWCFSLNQ